MTAVWQLNPNRVHALRFVTARLDDLLFVLLLKIVAVGVIDLDGALAADRGNIQSATITPIAVSVNHHAMQ